MLMAAGLPLFKQLHVHGYWTRGESKMSKSLGNVIRPLEMKQRFGMDAFRYFLLREMAFGQDATFSEDAFVTRVNADLANNLGNLVSRTLAMQQRYFAGSCRPLGEWTDEDAQLARMRSPPPVRRSPPFASSSPFHRALEALWRAIDHANKYIVTTAPFTLAKESRHRSRAPAPCCTPSARGAVRRRRAAPAVSAGNVGQDVDHVGDAGRCATRRGMAMGRAVARRAGHPTARDPVPRIENPTPRVSGSQGASLDVSRAARRYRSASPRLAAGEALIDSHCHLDMDEFRRRSGRVLQRAAAAGVTAMVTIGAGGRSRRTTRAVALAAAHDVVYATSVSTRTKRRSRPTTSSRRSTRWRSRRKSSASARPVSTTTTTTHPARSSVPPSRASSRWRGGDNCPWSFISVTPTPMRSKSSAAKARGRSAASFIVSPAMPQSARAFLDQGMHISFSGIVTFKNADVLREAARIVPADRLLIETDAPFLAPIPYRGKRNEAPPSSPAPPPCSPRCAAKPLAVVAENTRRNTERLFRLNAG
jgi:hypothetical protein